MPQISSEHLSSSARSWCTCTLRSLHSQMRICILIRRQVRPKIFAHVARLDFTISLGTRKFARSCKVLRKKVDNRDLGAVSPADPRASTAHPTRGLWWNFLMQRNMCVVLSLTKTLGEMKLSLWERELAAMAFLGRNEISLVLCELECRWRTDYEEGI